MKRHYRTTLKVGRDAIAGVIAIVVGGYLLMASSMGWTAWALFIVGWVLLAVVGCAIFLLPNWIYNSQPKLKDEYSLTFSDSGIEFKTNRIDSVLQWSLYRSWSATTISTSCTEVNETSQSSPAAHCPKTTTHVCEKC